MKRRTVILFGVLGCVLLLLIVTFIFPGKNWLIGIVKESIHELSGKKRNFSSVLTDVDSKIALGYYVKAEYLLNVAINMAYSKAQFLRVLKRGYFLFNATGNKRFWIELCRKAWKEIQAKEIGLLYTCALVEVGKYGEAAKILHGLKISEKSELSYLKDLLFVSLAVKAGYKANNINDKGLVALYNAIKQPTKISADTMEMIGREYSNAILLDAALLWAKEGSVSRAYSIVSKEIAISETNELKIYLSYDAGDLESTLRYIENYLASVNPNRTDLILLRADTLLQLGRVDEATRVYRGIIKNTPQFSWIPYYNLAKIYEIKGDMREAIKILERGVGIFKNSKVLVLYLIDLYVRIGNTTGAKLLVKDYYQKFPDDSSFALENLQLNISNYSPVRYSAELWNLFNRNEGNSTVARYLFIYLYSINDYTGAKEVLDRFVHATGGKDIPWVLHFYGLLDAADGNLKQAESKLKKSLEYKENWEVRYNLALVEMWMEKYDQALDEYNRLLAILNNPNFQIRNFSKKRVLSKIRYYRAKIYYGMGKFEICRRELEYSLELDKTNTKSILMLKKVNLEANSK